MASAEIEKLRQATKAIEDGYKDVCDENERLKRENEGLRREAEEKSREVIRLREQIANVTTVTTTAGPKEHTTKEGVNTLEPPEQSRRETSADLELGGADEKSTIMDLRRSIGILEQEQAQSKVEKEALKREVSLNSPLRRHEGRVLDSTNSQLNPSMWLIACQSRRFVLGKIVDGKLVSWEFGHESVASVDWTFPIPKSTLRI